MYSMHPTSTPAACCDLGLAVGLTAGKLGLHCWYLLGVGLVTLVIGVAAARASGTTAEAVLAGQWQRRQSASGCGTQRVWVRQS